MARLSRFLYLLMKRVLKLKWDRACLESNWEDYSSIYKWAELGIDILLPVFGSLLVVSRFAGVLSSSACGLNLIIPSSSLALPLIYNINLSVLHNLFFWNPPHDFLIWWTLVICLVWLRLEYWILLSICVIWWLSLSESVAPYSDFDVSVSPVGVFNLLFASLSPTKMSNLVAVKSF